MSDQHESDLRVYRPQVVKAIDDALMSFGTLREWDEVAGGNPEEDMMLYRWKAESP